MSQSITNYTYIKDIPFFLLAESQFVLVVHLHIPSQEQVLPNT